MLILKDKGGKQHCLPFCCFYPDGWDIFEKEGASEEGCVEIENWGISAHFVLWLQENPMQSLSAFLLFFGNKRNSKSFILFHSLIIGFLWFA